MQKKITPSRSPSKASILILYSQSYNVACTGFNSTVYLVFLKLCYSIIYEIFYYSTPSKTTLFCYGKKIKAKFIPQSFPKNIVSKRKLTMLYDGGLTA